MRVYKWNIGLKWVKIVDRFFSHEAFENKDNETATLTNFKKLYGLLERCCKIQIRVAKVK